MASKQAVMTVNELAAAARFTESGLVWRFPDLAVAKKHLRQYEKTIADWAFRMGATSAIVSGGGQELPITPRPSKVKAELTPIAAAPQFEDDGQLLIAQQWLNSTLLDVLLEMRNNPGIAALVCWESQKQVVMNQACSQIPIGEQLSDCLRYSRMDYWVQSDFAEFQTKCRQSLRQDGGNSIEQKYMTFDPTSGDDWIEVVGRYRFIDAGRLGLFQLGQNISFEHVAAPANR
jgi:hypothetical protein